MSNFYHDRRSGRPDGIICAGLLMKGNRPILGCLVAAIATLCFSQAQQGSRPAPGRGRAVSARPAFLLQAKFFEESQNVTKAVLKNDLIIPLNEFRRQPIAPMLPYVNAG